MHLHLGVNGVVPDRYLAPIIPKTPDKALKRSALFEIGTPEATTWPFDTFPRPNLATPTVGAIGRAKIKIGLWNTMFYIKSA
jgi:hypothetical protein